MKPRIPPKGPKQLKSSVTIRLTILELEKLDALCEYYFTDRSGMLRSLLRNTELKTVPEELQRARRDFEQLQGSNHSSLT